MKLLKPSAEEESQRTIFYYLMEWMVDAGAFFFKKRIISVSIKKKFLKEKTLNDHYLNKQMCYLQFILAYCAFMLPSMSKIFGTIFHSCPSVSLPKGRIISSYFLSVARTI
mmetsp:Transcript_19115/g.28091  ORF Transcript_19115/g.28091 Transcript_19115/m.28091 type:complete len:111 (+) Transcript_19115:1083-1415(+)